MSATSYTSTSSISTSVYFAIDHAITIPGNPEPQKGSFDLWQPIYIEDPDPALDTIFQWGESTWPDVDHFFYIRDPSRTSGGSWSDRPDTRTIVTSTSRRNVISTYTGWRLGPYRGARPSSPPGPEP